MKKKFFEYLNLVFAFVWTKLNMIVEFALKLTKTFYEDYRGNPSSRKIYAFIFVSISIIEKIKLVIFPTYHFAVALTAAKVSDSVIITLSTSMDLFAFGALAVYGWKENAANKPAIPSFVSQQTGAPIPTVAAVKPKGTVKTSEEG